MMKYPLRIQISSALGSGLIFALTVGVTYFLYKNGIENEVFARNYTTNLLLTDPLTQATASAPWALLSLNWFACRSAIKKWRKFLIKKYL